VYRREGINLQAFPAVVDTIRAEASLQAAPPPKTDMPASQNTLSISRDENVARAEADTLRNQQ
jgi:hypothetical protein